MLVPYKLEPTEPTEPTEPKPIYPNIIAINNERWVKEQQPFLDHGLIDWARLHPKTYPMADELFLIEEDPTYDWKTLTTSDIIELKGTLNAFNRLSYKLRHKMSSVTSEFLDHKKLDILFLEIIKLQAFKRLVSDEISLRKNRGK